MEQYRRWYIGILLASVLCAACIVATNYFINPYEIYKVPSIVGINDRKLYSNPYLWKARRISEAKEDALFLGSSRTGRGLDPEHYFAISEQTAFNAGLSGATFKEQQAYLEYAIQSNPQLKEVFLGLDFEGFNEYSQAIPAFKESRLATTRLTNSDRLETLFTQTALLDSLRVVRASAVSSSAGGDLILSDGSNDEQFLID